MLLFIGPLQWDGLRKDPFWNLGDKSVKGQLCVGNSNPQSWLNRDTSKFFHMIWLPQHILLLITVNCQKKKKKLQQQEEIFNESVRNSMKSFYQRKEKKKKKKPTANLYLAYDLTKREGIMKAHVGPPSPFQLSAFHLLSNLHRHQIN